MIMTNQINLFCSQSKFLRRRGVKRRWSEPKDGKSFATWLNICEGINISKDVDYFQLPLRIRQIN